MTGLVARHRRRDSERGASLILALAMIMIVSVALTGILGYAATSVHTIDIVRSQREISYSADGAVQTAIQTMDSDASAGASANGTACTASPVSYLAVGSQPAASVACTVNTSRGAGVPGTNMPPNSILTVGNVATEVGLNAAGTLKVGGPIVSSSPAAGSITAASTIDATGYTVLAKGTCTGTITVSVAADKTCSTGVQYVDPAYPSQTVSLTTANPMPTCTVANGVLQFSPGMYTNATMFETPTYKPAANTCTTGYLYFQPGVYYFDFDAAYVDTVWTVAANQHIVGGRPNGWDPNVANSLPPSPGGGVAKACKTEAESGADGVQFVFGGVSQLNVTAAGTSMELCADPTPTGTSQQIAIYGQKTGTTPTPQTSTLAPTAVGAVSTNPNWTNPTRALLVDTTNLATVALTSHNPGTISTITLDGFPGPPAGSSNVTFQVKVVHKESATASVATGGLTAQIASCAVQALTAGTALHTDTLPATAMVCPEAANAATFSVLFSAEANKNKAFTESLDGIQVLMTYTPPALRAQSGCTIVVNSCATITAGTGANVVVWGTVYTPLGSVLADGNTYEFRRGVIARAVKTTGTPDPGADGFCLGYGTPCVGPSRTLLFTATVGGATKLKALVKYFDAPTTGRRTEVLSWNVVR